ncbi:MAG: GNAT family N-acetyltransferase [Phycisphaerales bacterium]
MVRIRPERPSDADAVARLLEGCFPTDAEARLVAALRRSGQLVVALVAENDGAIVGHIAFSPVTAAGARAGVGLAPVAVEAAHRRRGLGAALIERGLERCRAAGAGWCVVLGDPAYYARYGFRPAREDGLADAYNGGDAFQVLALVSGAVPRGAGLVRYSDAFDDLG